jgi:hypothetical protein
MNRLRAMGALGGRINGDGSGKEEWLRRTKSNKSLNPTGLSVSFIEKLAVAQLSSGGLSLR